MTHEIAAFHEAGHTVIAVHFRRRIRAVSLDSEEEGWTKCTGIAPISRYLLPAAVWRQRCFEEAQIALGGIIAELRAGRYEPECYEVDIQNAARWRQRAGVDAGVLIRRTDSLIHQRWGQVKAIAERLSRAGHLTGAEVAATMARAAQKLPAVALAGRSAG